jgi:hypothetical protein
MAFLYDVVYDKDTRRHRLEFINQQFDYLMGIEFDDELGRYKLSVDEAEADKISSLWAGRKFDTEYWMRLASTELDKADKKLPRSL